jgi:nucleoside-diphosphate-sugar epimerase
MPLTAFVIGGSGLVGAAVVRRLAERGFEVTAAARGRRNPPAGLDEVARLVTVDRSDDAALGAALGDGVDVLVDTAAFRAEDGEQLVALRDRYASVVVLSSASVYTDGAGRSIDEAESPEEFPDLPVPVSERVPTLPAGDATYSTRKVAIERALLGAEGVRPTVIRPGAVYGPHGSSSSGRSTAVRTSCSHTLARAVSTRRRSRTSPSSSASRRSVPNGAC